MSSTVRHNPALLWLDLVELVDRAVTRFKLTRSPILEPIRRRSGITMDGKADKYPPRIQLRLYRYNRPNQAFAMSTVMAILAHELAHFVKGGWDHGPEHRRITREVAAWIREQGYPVSTQLFAGTGRNRIKKRVR